MGFTGGTGHVWKTTNAGASWTDFTANLPDSPVNAVVIDAGASQIFVGTDVGVFASSTSTASWTELGPDPSTGLPGNLPNVAVTALALFNSGGQKLLRASTYGRGIWQFNLVTTPDYQLAILNSPQTVFLGQTTTFSGAATEFNGYTSGVALSCVAGTTAPPSTCSDRALHADSREQYTFHRYSGWRERRLQFQRAGRRVRRETHHAPDSGHAACGQFCDEYAIARKCDGRAWNHIRTRKFPDQRRRIVQPERDGHVLLRHRQRALYAYAWDYRQSYFEHSSEHDRSRNGSSRNGSRQLSSDDPGIDVGNCRSDAVIHAERYRKSRLRFDRTGCFSRDQCW